MGGHASDLMSMVGGKTEQRATTRTQPRKKAPELKRPAFGKAKALAAPAKKKEPSPEDIIPLNDDDFSDF